LVSAALADDLPAMIYGEPVGLDPIRRALIAIYQRWFNEL
jgi:hypothetical protein